MMNNLVFNRTADQLKVTVGAFTSAVTIANTSLTVGGTVTVSEISTPVTIANTSLTVAGTVTVSEISTPVTIANTSLTVAGTVTVSEISTPVTIANTSLTVAGTVTVSEISTPVTIANTSLTVAGTVTVSEISTPVTIANTSLTVAGSVTISNASITTSIGGYAFTSATVSSATVTGTGVLFDDTDTSQIKVASMFLYNGGTVPVTIAVQVSPTTNDADYIDDPLVPAFPLGTIAQAVQIGTFAHYTRLQYRMGTFSGTVTAYYNAQA